MKKFGFGKRLLAMLLALTMIVSFLPATAVKAAVGDIVDGDTELSTNIDTHDTISWPIKIYDFLNDGMLFDWSMQNFDSTNDTSMWNEEDGLAYYGGYSMPFSAEYHIGEDFTSRQGYYKLKTGTTSYAFANWGNLSAYSNHYDDNATEVSRKAVAPVDNVSPMYLHHEYVGSGNTQAYGWISNFARDSKEYYTKDEVRYLVMVYRTNELYSTNTSGQGREMQAYWSVSPIAADSSYGFDNVDISDMWDYNQQFKRGWKANGFRYTGLLSAERVKVLPSEEWTYIIVDMKTDLQKEAYSELDPMTDSYNYGIAHNWNTISGDQISGVGIGLPLGSKGEQMDITHVSYFGTYEEARYFGDRAVKFNNEPGIYVAHEVTTTQTNSGVAWTSYSRDSHNGFGFNVGSEGLVKGVDTSYVGAWAAAYRESYSFYTGYYSNVKMSAADGCDFSDTTMMHYRRLTATAGVERKTHAVSASAKYWITNDEGTASSKIPLAKYAVLVYRTNNISNLKIGYWFENIYDSAGSVGEDNGLSQDVPESKGSEYVYAVLDLCQFDNSSMKYFDTIGLEFYGMDDGESIDIVYFDLHDTKESATAYGARMAYHANNPTATNNSKYSVTVASSANKSYQIIGGGNRGFGMLYGNIGGGWTSSGGSNSYSNGYYSYQIGYNVFNPNGTVNANRTTAASKGYVVSNSIFHFNTTPSSTFSEDNREDISKYDFGYTLYNTLKGRGLYTAGLLQSSLVTYTGIDGEEYRIFNYKSDTVGYIAGMLYESLVIPAYNANGALYNHVMGEKSPMYCEDIDGDGRLDTKNEDLDGDGNLDVNEDKDGNGILDLGEDLDYDGNLDVNEDINGNGRLDLSEDLDGDGRLDINEDADGDGLIDPGEDVDGDGHLDVDEDKNGNGRLDLSEDLDGDGRLDTQNEDKNGNGVLDPSEDLDGDGRLDRYDEDLDGDGHLDVNEDKNGNGVLDSCDLATALRECLGVTYASGYENATTQAGTMGGNKGRLGSYAETLAKTNVNGVNRLIGPFLQCAPYIETHYDAAYYMLHNLFVGDSYNQTQYDYNYLVMSKATVEGENKDAYVFDAGFTFEDGTSAVVYDRTNKTISLATAEAKKQVVYIGSSTTNITAFLPVYDGDDEPGDPFGYTIPRYPMEEGAMNSRDVGYDSYVNRNYNYTLQANGEFVFHYDDSLFFNFEGDDDVYLFINGELVLDIGGAHSITKVGFNTNDYVDAARSTLNKLSGYYAGMEDEDFERVLSNNGITGDTAKEYRRLHKLNLVDGKSYTIDFYYMERHGWGANMRIATNIVMTDPALETNKQAFQGTDGNGEPIEVEFGSLVDDSQPIDYSFTITNRGNTKMYKMSFKDANIGVNLSYDNGLQTYGKPTTTQFTVTADTVMRITGLDGAINLDGQVYNVYQNGKVTWQDAAGNTKTANGISISYNAFSTVKNTHTLTLYQLNSQALFQDVTAYVDLGGTAHYRPTESVSGVYHLSMGKTNLLTISGVRVADESGGVLDVSDLRITVRGYASYEDYVNGKEMTPITIKLNNNEQLKKFLFDLTDPKRQTSSGESIPDGKSSLYWGAGLWQHSSITIDGMYYTLTKQEQENKVFDNTVYTYSYKSPDAKDPMKGQDHHRVYSPGEPTYYQWSEREVYLTVDRMWQDVLNASADSSNVLYEQKEGIDRLNQYGVNSLTLQVTDKNGDRLTSSYNLYSGGVWSTYKQGQTDASNDYRTLYFRQIYDWDNLYMYYWSDSDVNMVQWPGKKMSAVAGENLLYSCQVPSEARYIIFTNGEGEQTKTVTIPFVDYNKVTWDGSNRLLKVDYNQPGMHTFYVKVSSSGTSETVVVPVTFYVTEVKDAYYVLDYGLTSIGLNASGQLFQGDRLLGSHLLTSARLMGVSTIQPSYLSTYSSTAAANHNINRINITTTTPIRSNPSSSEDLSVYVDVGDGKYYLGSTVPLNGTEIYFDGSTYSMDKRIWFTPEDFMDQEYNLWLAITVHEADESFAANASQTGYHIPGKENSGTMINSSIDIGSEVQMYKKLTVLPATVVYYEDDFQAIEYTGYPVDNNDKTAGKFVHHGAGTGALTQGVDQDTPYGQDETYRADSSANMSGGSMTTVNITDTSDVATFTFSGTGFELISRTNASDSASIVVEVFEATAAGEKVSETPVKRVPVVTEFTSTTSICRHNYHNTNGYCALCGLSVSHTYQNGACVICNAPEVDYYLFGYIDGVDVGADNTNYKFVDGRLTATFSEDTYLAVHDTHGKQYWTNGYPGNEVTSAILFDTTAPTAANIQADKLRVPGGVQVTLTLVDNGNGSMTLSYSTVIEQHGDRTLYFDNSKTGWEDVYIYYWTNGVTAQNAWPGVLMSKKATSDLYFYTVPSDATYVIFNNGTGGESNQTGDLLIPGDGFIYRDGGWTLDQSGLNSKTVYFHNTFGGVTPFAYFWSDSNPDMTKWPGVPMTEVQDNVYAIDLPADATKIIFNDGTNQSGDLIIPGDRYLYNGVEWSKYTGQVAETKVVYFENRDGWETPTVYYWALGSEPVSWPGIEMNKIGSTNFYWCEIPVAMTNVIFSDNGNDQTGNLTLNSEKTLYSNGTWKIYEIPDSETRIYFENTANWSNVYVYYWGESTVAWPGVKMENAGTDILVATIPADARYVIFSDGGTNQTNDLTFSSDKKLYSYEDAENGTWYPFTDESGKEVRQVPVIRINDLPYGKYIVEISGMPQYRNDTDWTSSDLSQYVKPTYLYIDGVRIYQPLGASNAAYSAAENSAAFHELRNLILNGKAAVATYDVSTTVYSGDMSWSENRNGYLSDPVTGEVKTYVGNQLSSINDYLMVGPNNEIYVNGNLKQQSVIFYVTEQPGATQRTLQVAVRGLDQGMYLDGKPTGVAANLYQSVRMEYPDGSKGYGWQPVADIISGTEQYYTIDYSSCPYTVINGVRTYQVALYVRNGMVSFSSLKTLGLNIKQAIGEDTVLFFKDGFLANPAYTLVTEDGNGEYEFKDGKLEVTFEKDTYVSVQWDTSTGRNVYLTDGDIGYATSATLINKNKLEGNGGMMFVPGGVKATFTLTNISGASVDLSYTIDPSTCKHLNRDEDGRCFACGQLEYYLFGWINGNNYGCEEDAENMGEYKFDEHGLLTVTFREDSYVGVKTSGNAMWYMTDGWLGDNVTSAMLYNADELSEADKLRVPGGAEVTFTLKRNADGTMLLSYVVACDHTYEAYVVNPTCTKEGNTEYICIDCGTGYSEPIPATGHSYASVVTKPTCYVGGYTTYTCRSCGHSYTGDHVPANDHNFNVGVCTECGKNQDGFTGYYLFGWINGADYGCEDDWETLGVYKFTGSTLTTTFAMDSYVAVKTGDNNNWYMTQAYAPTSPAVLVNTNKGGYEKLYVPGGVQVTFTLVENADDSLTLSYVVSGASRSSAINMVTIEQQMNAIFLENEGEAVQPDVDVQPETDVLQPLLKMEYASVSFESEIHYNIYFSALDMDDVEKVGMILFNEANANGDISSADQVIDQYQRSGDLFMVQTEGVSAKEMGDDIYFKAYAKLTDGSYVYTGLKTYNAVRYANSILAKSQSESMKALVVSMLNYGAEAQKYFGYRTDSLMNASLTEDQKALAQPYGEDTMPAPGAVDSSKNGIFTANGFGKSTITASFEAAFAMNYYVTPSYVPDGDVTLYYWTEEAYASVDTLKPENASGSVVMTAANAGDRYCGTVSGIAAKEMGDTIYAAAVYESNGVTYSTVVMNYSMGKYCDTVAGRASSTQRGLSMAAAVYGASARAYFESL